MKMSGSTSAAKPKICLIYTGGTIGMRRVKQGDGKDPLQPLENAEDFLRHLKVEDAVREIAELDFVAIMNKDSSNIVPDDWTVMAKAVHQRLNQYDGFVVAHGTDTLHFSATALAFAFGDKLPKPVVFTGSQTTAEVSHGDAATNLLRAIKVASEDIAEVVVAFGDYVFRGCRVQKKDERRFDAFESPAEQPIGIIAEEVHFNHAVIRHRPDQAQALDFQPYFADGIVQLSLMPGLKPAMFQSLLMDDACCGVMLQSFGAGNVPNEGEYSFEAFIRNATKLHKPVIIVSQFPANSTLGSRYAPGLAALQAGGIATGNMTNAAAAVKFRWVLHQVNRQIAAGTLTEDQRIDKVRNMMGQIYVREMSL